MASQVVEDETSLPTASSAARVHIPFLAASVLVASALGAMIIGRLGNVFLMPQDFADMPLQPSPELMARYKAAVSTMYAGNYSIHFAILGGAIGAAIGLAGPARNRWVAALAAATAGALAGAVGGYVMGLASSYFVNEVQGESVKAFGLVIDPIVQTTALQCFVWSLVGVGIGITWAATTRGSSAILAGFEGGLIGGVLGGMIYSISAAMLFTVSNAFLFVPEKMTERIVWACIGGLSIALGLAYSAGKRSQRVAASDQPRATSETKLS